MSLSGAATWFLTVLVETYFTNPFLPSESINQLLAGLVAVTLRWYATPGVTAFEVIGSLGLGAIVAGIVLASTTLLNDADVPSRVKRLMD